MSKTRRSIIEDHPRFNDFMRIFDAMRMKGKIQYKVLGKSIQNIDPSIPQYSIYFFFKRFTDNYLLKKDILRGELRRKKKVIADGALEEVLKDPEKLALKDRINIGRDAVSEELREIAMVLNEKHKQKEESMLEKLLDEARYGEPEPIEAEFSQPTSLLDKRVSYGGELPDLTKPEPAQITAELNRESEESR